jgi:hypothetical protein
MRSFCLVLLVGISISSFSQTTFQTFQIDKILSNDFSDLAAADYDNDGDVDFVGTGSKTEQYTNSVTTLMKNNGGKNFSPVPVVLKAGEQVEWMDIDNDNDLDLFVVGCIDGCGTYLYINRGNDVFEEAVTGMGGAASISGRDFNLDGKIDVVLRKDTDFYFYKNMGNSVFTLLEKTDIDFSLTLAWTDFNNDGYPDFASGNKLYRNNGDETFTTLDPGFINNGISTYLWADFDNDNDQDFVRHGSSYVYNSSTSNFTYTHTLKVYENQGSNTFIDKGSLLGLVSMSTPPVAADFDNDGDVDFVINGTKTSDEYSGYEAKIYWNNGNFSFAGENVNDGISYRYIFCAADFDNDLDVDFVLSYPFLSTQRGLENKATTVATRPDAPVPSPVSISGDDFTLSWAAAHDAESPKLLYNLYVKRDGVFAITPQADITKGWSLVPGYANMESLLEQTFNTSSWPEGFYTWGTQAIDHEMNASLFSTESTFEIRRNVPLTTPAGLNASGVTSTSVALQWTDQSSNEGSFDVERSVTSGNGGFQVIASLPPNTVSFSENTLQPSQA